MVFEKYEEAIPLQMLRIPLYIFAHERHYLQTLVSWDGLDDLSSIELPRSFPGAERSGGAHGNSDGKGCNGVGESCAVGSSGGSGGEGAST